MEESRHYIKNMRTGKLKVLIGMHKKFPEVKLEKEEVESCNLIGAS